MRFYVNDIIALGFAPSEIARFRVTRDCEDDDLVVECVLIVSANRKAVNPPECRVLPTKSCILITPARDRTLMEDTRSYLEALKGL